MRHSKLSVLLSSGIDNIWVAHHVCIASVRVQELDYAGGAAMEDTRIVRALKLSALEVHEHSMSVTLIVMIMQVFEHRRIRRVMTDIH